MKSDTVFLSVDCLRNFMEKVFVKLGVPEEDAVICADVLITSDLHGIESHGIGRLKMYYDRIREGILNPVTKIDVMRDKGATAVWDGNHGMGHVIGKKAMHKAIEKAGQYGVGIVTVRNSSHYGIAGYYAKLAVEQGMIGITFTNARPSIAPTFGTTPMLGTNPICFGAPSDMDYPFLFDAATSISQRGKIEVLDREEKETPSGWAIDSEGNPYTDTPKLLVDLIKQNAAMLPLGGIGETMGGHKGYGLATMVEILCASLQNGSFLNGLHGFDQDGKRVPHALGHFFMAIDISFFTEPEDFCRTTGEIMRQLKGAKLAIGAEKIFIAGEKEHENIQRVMKEGVPVIPNLQKNIRIMQEKLGLDDDLIPRS